LIQTLLRRKPAKVKNYVDRLAKVKDYVDRLARNCTLLFHIGKLKNFEILLINLTPSIQLGDYNKHVKIYYNTIL